MHGLSLACLYENTRCDPSLKAGHGLSMLIETAERTILFDMGEDAAFAENAHRMRKDLKKVDTAILSHGHDDHGGGIPAFFTLNTKAPLLFHPDALYPTYSGRSASDCHDIGIADIDIPETRADLISANRDLGNGITVYAGFENTGFIPSYNKFLFRKNPDTGRIGNDPFLHELALSVDTGNTRILFTGCSHSGVSNMVRTVIKTGFIPDTLVGGFHLSSSQAPGIPDPRTAQLAKELLALPVNRYITCHCTGVEGFAVLKHVMGSRLGSISTGDIMHFD